MNICRPLCSLRTCEVYDSEAALQAHRATDHFKAYAATTANMVAKREVRAMSPVALNSKGH
jgi:quinol monooxygenase YgiN